MRAQVLLPLAALLAGGCGQAYYRNSADRETYPILAAAGAMRPGYDIGRLQLAPPPGSRIADPFDPDHPPKPPDDPASAVLMAHPGRWNGASDWGVDGFTNQIEPAGWETALGAGADGVVTLDQDKSVEIALLNSREYQTQLETVYQAALSQTLNRFDFDVHWFGTNTTNYTHFGTGGTPTETNTLTSNTNGGLTQNFLAGGQFLVELANALTYEYSGGTSQFNSNILLSLTQPLLRNFGRKVRMETLTLGERNVLYAVRSYARYRKQFWVSVAIQSGGYLDLLLALQTVRNDEANLSRQEETYRLYSELFRGGRASAVEFDQFYQSVLAARQALINDIVALETAKDQFKLKLGIPPRVPVALDDRPLQQFVLTDPLLERLRTDLEVFQKARLSELDALPSTVSLRRYFAALKELAARTPNAVQLASNDLNAWGRRLARPPRPGEDPEQTERERATFANLKPALSDAATDLIAATALIDRAAAAVTEETRREAWEASTECAKKLLAALDGVISVQTQARIYQIELPDFDGAEAESLVFAKQARLDLQNQLGMVTDAWRQVTVAANALKGDLTVVGSANLGTNPTRDVPFAFSAAGSTYMLQLQIDTPLNRVAERNQYRTSLINYQQMKRAYVALSDQIESQIRADIRQLNRLRVSFGIARQTLLSAARQYENARLTLLGPRDKRGTNDTTTLNLLQALTNLLAARNALAASYINFEQQRLQFLLDLEALQLDQRGFPTNAAPRHTDSTNDRGADNPGNANPGPPAGAGPPPGP